MIQYIRAEAVADYDAADGTTAFTIEAPFAGKLLVDRCFVRTEEEVGTMTTTAAVLSLEVGGTEVGTLTAVAATPIGDTQKFTADGTNAVSRNGAGEYDFSAGDDIEVITKTQAVGGTVTGTGRAYLAVEFGL